jgi:hypothetical protein
VTGPELATALVDKLVASYEPDQRVHVLTAVADAVAAEREATVQLLLVQAFEAAHCTPAGQLRVSDLATATGLHTRAVRNRYYTWLRRQRLAYVPARVAS